jgi:ribosome-interacting GTPase 1
MKEELERLRESMFQKRHEYCELERQYNMIWRDYYRNTLEMNLDLNKDLKEQIWKSVQIYEKENNEKPKRLIFPIEQRMKIISDLCEDVFMDFGSSYAIERIMGIEVEWKHN